MSFLWFLVITILCVVNCEYVSDSYILEMPDSEVLKTSNNYPFKVYWNVPTKQCRYQKNSIPFDDVLRKYGISYNTKDKFEGETITIIYDGGYMPAILSRDGAKYTIRNGGLPQEGDLELHLTAFRETVMRLIPDPDFKGLGVIDMENWRPIFRQHWSKLTSIIDLSLSIEKRQFWWWPTSWLKMEATKRFEDAARIFMEQTLSTAKQMRPKALWGYYGFPYCFNMDKDMKEHCSKAVKEENDRTYWLWAESTALYPSLYSPTKFSTSELEALVRGRLVEANRVKQAGALVLPYFWLKYRDEKFFREKDLIAVFETLQKKNVSGVIIWGSSNDVNQFEKCKELYDYVNSSFGPIVRKYINRINMLHEEKTKGDSKNVIVPNGSFNNTINVVTTTHKIISNNNRANINKDLITTEKSENIFYNIIEQDQLSEYLYETDNNKTDIKNSNESSIWDIISYDSESIQPTKPYMAPSVTNKTISNKTSPLSNFISITAEIFSVNDSSHIFNNKSDNDLKTIDNSTFTTIITNNNTGNIDLTNLLKTSVIYKLTKITTEMDSKSIPTNPEKQLNKYFYEMDDNRTGISSNESDFWTIIEYQATTEQDTDSGNLHIVKQKHTESYYDYPSITEKTIPEDTPNLENTNIKLRNIFNNLDILSLTANFSSPINSSVNKNNSEIFITDTVPLWLRTKNNSEVLHNFDEKRKMTNDSFKNIEETFIERNSILDVNSAASLNKSGNGSSQNVSQEEQVIKNTETIDSSYSRENDISDYLIRAEANTENTPEFPTSQNVGTSDMREIDISDYLIVVALKPSNTATISIENNVLHGSMSSGNSTSPVKSDNDTDIIENVKAENSLESSLSSSNNSSRNISENVIRNEQLIDNTTDPSVKLTISEEDDELDDSLLSMENSITTVTRLMSSNYTDIIGNMKAENSSESTLSLQNNYSRGIPENVKQGEQLLNNTTNPSVKSTVSNENDIQDGYVSSTENPIKPITISISGNDSNITENVITENSLESTLSYTNNFSRNISENVKRDEQLITKPSFKSTISLEDDVFAGSVSSTENQIKPVTISISGNDSDIIENVIAENSLESTLSSTNNFSRNISENVKRDEQLITKPSVKSTISLEDDVFGGSVLSTENSITPVTRLISGKYTDIIGNENAGNSLESTLSLPNNFSRDIFENVKEDERSQFLTNTTCPHNEEPVSSPSNISDYLIVLAKETSPMNTSVNNNDAKVKDNVKSESTLEFTVSPPTNFSKVSQNIDPAEHQSKINSYFNAEAIPSRDNNISDYLITVTSE